MTRFKDFGGSDTDANTEPLEFKLYNETFYAVPEIQGAVLLDFIKKSGSEDVAVSATVLIGIIKDVLLDESLVRFEALINSKDRIVKVDKLGEIAGWLIEEYSGVPEGQPEA